MIAVLQCSDSGLHKKETRIQIRTYNKFNLSRETYYVPIALNARGDAMIWCIWLLMRRIEDDNCKCFSRRADFI